MSSALPNTASETLLHIRGEMLTPLPEGGLWWAARGVLIVSDLHLEKGSSFATHGQMLPPYDTAATLNVVEKLVRALSPEMVISLGDSFHDRRAERRMAAGDIARVQALTSVTDWIWVEGNHDPDPPAHLGGRAAKVLHIGDLVFRHEPTAEIGEIAGHLHPAAKVITKHRSLRRRCFVSDGQRLVMPSMGAFTGGLNVLDPAFDPAFPDGGKMICLIGAGRVYPVSNQRLLADGPRADIGRWRMNRSRQADS